MKKIPFFILIACVLTFSNCERSITVEEPEEIDNFLAITEDGAQIYIEEPIINNDIASILVFSKIN